MLTQNSWSIWLNNISKMCMWKKYIVCYFLSKSSAKKGVCWFKIKERKWSLIYMCVSLCDDISSTFYTSLTVFFTWHTQHTHCCDEMLSLYHRTGCLMRSLGVCWSVRWWWPVSPMTMWTPLVAAKSSGTPAPFWTSPRLSVWWVLVTSGGEAR